MNTARNMLVEGGLEALTLPKLAQAAGVSVPTVYRHFPTLDDLYRAFIEWLRPLLGLNMERLLAKPAADLAELPLENFPRYEQHKAVLRPLMESSEFNRVRVASVRDRARKAREQLGDLHGDFSEAELESLLGAVWVLGSPQTWRWLRDTWGSENDEAAKTASWGMRTLLDALMQGPQKAKAEAREKKKAKAARAPKKKR